jgi:alpha-tubulin suppressor-like RCC1 family protein
MFSNKNIIINSNKFFLIQRINLLNKNKKNFAVGLEAVKNHKEQITKEIEKKLKEEKLKQEEEQRQKIINQKLKEMGKYYKTSVYLWNNSAAVRIKKSDMKNQMNNSYKPERLKFFDDKSIKSIYCGLSHTALITDEGYLYMFGENHYGQLGQGNVDSITKENPKIVPYLAEKNIRIKKVCCTVNNTIALSEDGDVYSWGYGGKHSRKFAVYKSNNYEI